MITTTLAMVTLPDYIATTTTTLATTVNPATTTTLATVTMGLATTTTLDIIVDNDGDKNLATTTMTTAQVITRRR